jgi:integrase
MVAIKTQTIDDYRAARRKEPGQKHGETLSPTTVNKDLRHLRAVLKKAFKWGYLPAMPDFDFEREPKKLPRYVIPEHFALIYRACDHATMPEGQGYSAADWWRALLVFCYMTGWRISEVLALAKDDLNLETGEAITRAEDNKGKRDERIKLHPLVLEHLRLVPSFGPTVLPWGHNRRTLDVELDRIQAAAGVYLPCSKKHEHTDACHRYSFHDLRRAFATMNADRLTADALQALMRHKSYQTTQVYINMARQLDEAVEALHVPEFLKKGLG